MKKRRYKLEFVENPSEKGKELDGIAIALHDNESKKVLPVFLHSEDTKREKLTKKGMQYLVEVIDYQLKTMQYAVSSNNSSKEDTEVK